MDEQRGVGFVLLTDQKMDKLLDSVDSKNTKKLNDMPDTNLKDFAV